MEIAEGIAGAAQILQEERQRPTIRYTDIANEWIKRYKEMTPQEIAGWTKITSVPRKNLAFLRDEYPRLVSETPQIYSFGGTNYDLLLAIFGQLNQNDRHDLVAYLLWQMESSKAYALPEVSAYYPVMGISVSELPLVAEFCIRTGNTELFFEALEKLRATSVAVAIMMMQLEDTIANNFNLFSREQLGKIPVWLTPLQLFALQRTHPKTGPPGGPFKPNPDYRAGEVVAAKQIIRSISGIKKECDQARYWYLKGALQQTVNLEIESDKATVENFLTKLGFNDQMAKALNAAENDFRQTVDPFDLKSSLGHLRSFLEHLHRETAKSIAAAAGETPVDRWGDATSYLRQKAILTKPEEQFSASLYTLMSDESVHPLVAERDHARLLRNVVIEYGVMFLSVLDKKGVKLK